MKKGECSNTEVKNTSLKKTNMNSFTQSFFIYTEPAEEDTRHRNKTKILTRAHVSCPKNRQRKHHRSPQQTGNCEK